MTEEELKKLYDTDPHLTLMVVINHLYNRITDLEKKFEEIERK